MAVGFLFANIIASQFIPSEYFSLINRDVKATAQAINNFKNTPYYEALLREQLAIYGDEIVAGNFDLGAQQDAMKLEAAWQVNQQNPQILHALSVRAAKNGNMQEAQVLSQKAAELDPQYRP
jgi:hypothetical protein